MIEQSHRTPNSPEKTSSEQESCISILPKAWVAIGVLLAFGISVITLPMYISSTRDQDDLTKACSITSNYLENVYFLYKALEYFSSLRNDLSASNMLKLSLALLLAIIFSSPPALATYSLALADSKLRSAVEQYVGTIPMNIFALIVLYETDLRKFIYLPHTVYHGIRFLIHDAYYSGNKADIRESQDIELRRRAFAADFKTLEKAMKQADLNLSEIPGPVPTEEIDQIRFFVNKYNKKKSLRFFKSSAEKLISFPIEMIKLLFKIILSAALIWSAIGLYCNTQDTFSDKPFDLRSPYPLLIALFANSLLFLVCRSGGWDLAEDSSEYSIRCIEKKGLATTTLSKIGLGGKLGLISDFFLLALAGTISAKSGYTAKLLYEGNCSFANDTLIPPKVSGEIVDKGTVVFNGIYVHIALTFFILLCIKNIADSKGARNAYLNELTIFENIKKRIKYMSLEELNTYSDILNDNNKESEKKSLLNHDSGNTEVDFTDKTINNSTINDSIIKPNTTPGKFRYF